MRGPENATNFCAGKTLRRCRIGSRRPWWSVRAVAAAALLSVTAIGSAAAASFPAFDVITNRGCGDQAVFISGEYLDFTVRLLESIDEPFFTFQVLVTINDGQRFSTSGRLTNEAPDQNFSGNRRSVQVVAPGPGSISVKLVSSDGSSAPVICDVVISADATPPPTTTPTDSPTPTLTPTPGMSTPTPSPLQPTATMPPDASPSATPSATATPSPGFGSGDANCDGAVTAADPIRYATLINTQTRAPCLEDDTNADGMINESDVRAAVAAIFRTP